MATIIPMKGLREAPKAVRSSMETVILTADQMMSWRVPPFQRELRVNDKVRSVAEKLKATGGIVPGIITLGTIGADKTIYIVDGQHRREAFTMSELRECIADVRMCQFDTMAEMAREYVELNSNLVKMRPDDVLRGLEASVRSLCIIRQACEFVGYGNIRRAGSSSPVLSMSAVLRCWAGSASETPGGSGGKSALHLAEETDESAAQNLVAFLQIARSAWGADQEYFRLWGNLNLTICMWMYRRLVMDKERGIKRYVCLSPDQFRKCLMAVSASSEYLDWLTGRLMGDRDRSPCYMRLKATFQNRLRQDSRDPTKKPLLPLPGWASK